MYLAKEFAANVRDFAKSNVDSKAKPYATRSLNIPYDLKTYTDANDWMSHTIDWLTEEMREVSKQGTALMSITFSNNCAYSIAQAAILPNLLGYCRSNKFDLDINYQPEHPSEVVVTISWMDSIV